MPKKQTFDHVKRVKRPNGSIDYYHRLARNEQGKMPQLPGEYGSVEFVEEWLKWEKQRAINPKPDETNTPISYRGLWEAYSNQATWADRTRADYDKVMAWLLPDWGDTEARLLEQRHAEILLDKAISECWYRFGEYVLQVNRAMYNWVLERDSRKKKWGKENPWATIKMPKKARGKRPNRAWKPEEVAMVLMNAPMGLARCYVMGASGFDVSTMHRVVWSDYQDGLFDNDRIKSGVSGITRVPAPLRPILDNGPRPAVQICTNEKDLPFASPSSISTASSKFLRNLREEEKVGAGLTMHGLRHTIAKAIADGGGSLRAIQTALRHSSTRMSLHYSEEADKRRALFSVSDAVDSFFIGTPPDEGLAQKEASDKND